VKPLPPTCARGTDEVVAPPRTPAKVAPAVKIGWPPSSFALRRSDSRAAGFEFWIIHRVSGSASFGFGDGFSPKLVFRVDSSF
jgi:hypothetical protein